MEPIVLTDPAITPDKELITSIIGDKSVLWDKIMEHLYSQHKDISEVWRYYNDGKCWLFRTLKRKKPFSGSAFSKILSESVSG